MGNAGESVGQPAVPRRIFQLIQCGQLRLAFKRVDRVGVWRDQSHGCEFAADSVLVEAHVLRGLTGVGVPYHSGNRLETGILLAFGQP